jgi:predicted nucleic acid-binding protein
LRQQFIDPQFTGVPITEYVKWVRQRAERLAKEQYLSLEQVSITEVTWSRAAHLGNELARKGQSVPLPDLLIATAALQHSLPLLTVDSEFQTNRSRRAVVSRLFGAD